VQGTCPHCSADGARGDQCDTCGKLIDSLSLVEPKCKICGNTPIIKETNHWFLSLPAFSERLKQWLENKPNWKDNVKKFILSWIEEGLIERSITRDIDWGVPVPLPDAKGKVLYVWFDAPIGYISSTIEWSKKIGQPELWKKYWLDKDTKLVHFIGKDNIPFHAIIWPAILMGQDDDYVLPYDIPANEYLTLEGQKISTSNEWAIWVEEYLHFFDGELLRFYLATNAPETKDADFTWKDFQNVINNTLANVLGNLANRVFAFAQKNFDGTLRYRDSEFITSITDSCAEIHEAYTEFKVRKAVKCIMDIAREGNKFFDEAKPWVLIKHDKSVAEKTLYECAELLRIISITLYPILPKSMQRLRDMMTISGHIYWEDIYNPPKSIQIGVFEPLFKKIEDEDIKRQIEMLYKNAP
jgi:methionyl-tRNA synthetase